MLDLSALAGQEKACVMSSSTCMVGLLAGSGTAQDLL